MILGISTTKSAVVIAETRGAGAKFGITAIRPIHFQVRTGDDLAELRQSLLTLFARKGKHAGSVIALLRCSSGRFGSGLEAIKGEAITELVAAQCHLAVVKVAPQSLKKTLGCAPGQKWRDRAAELFDPAGQQRNWSKGAAGAVAVAFKVAGDETGQVFKLPKRGLGRSAAGSATPAIARRKLAHPRARDPRKTRS
jgi:hypothetical protein